MLKVEKKKPKSMPMRDVTYATPAFPPNNDIFVAIVLGHNAKPKHVVRAHVFKCDSTDMVSKIVALIMRAVSSAPYKAYVSKVEDDLLRRKLVDRSVDRSSYVLGNFNQQRAFVISSNNASSAQDLSANAQQAHQVRLSKTTSNVNRGNSDDQ